MPFTYQPSNMTAEQSTEETGKNGQLHSTHHVPLKAWAWEGKGLHATDLRIKAVMAEVCLV